MRLQNATIGMIHVHTSFSRDGEMTPDELRRLCLREGLSFACITDHAEDVSNDQMRDLVRSCDKASDAIFSMVPGLEFAVDGHIHVMAIGLRYKPREPEPLGLLRELRKAGALTILAHPIASGAQINRQILSMLDGIEVWNGSHDGGFFPNPAAFRFYNRALAEAPHLLAFGGNDFHSPSQPVRVRTIIQEEAPLPDILEGLAAGRFEIRGRLWRTGSRPVVGAPSAAALVTSYGAYTSGKRLRDMLRQWGGLVKET